MQDFRTTSYQLAKRRSDCKIADCKTTLIYIDYMLLVRNHRLHSLVTPKGLADNMKSIIIFTIYFMYWRIDLMSLPYVIQPMCWNCPVDLTTQKNRSRRTETIKGMRFSNCCCSRCSLYVPCDQVDQAVPAFPVDDIEEAH